MLNQYVKERIMEQYEIMKEDAILGPYNVEYPDSFRTVAFSWKDTEKGLR